MSARPDILRFLDGDPSTPDRRDYNVGWTGPWPPPEKFLMAVGKQTGQVHIIEDEPGHLEKALTVATVYEFERKTYSKLEKDADGNSTIWPGVPAVRGAEYALVGEVTT